MSDIKLFRIVRQNINELVSNSVDLEKSLQNLMERHLELLLGVKFLATEYSTGKIHGGRIDTLGLDENGFPVIIEYKRTIDENIITQGLSYLTWLEDHRAEFEKLVRQKYGEKLVSEIEWSYPHLICIASDFKKHDLEAAKSISKGNNIELIKYRQYESDLLLLEMVFSVTRTPSKPVVNSNSSIKKPIYKSVSEYLDQSPQNLKDLFSALEVFFLALGDDVQKRILKMYIAYKRIKNFACVEIHPQSGEILIFAKVDPDTIRLEEGFTRDVRNVGHFGTGDLEIRIKTMSDLERSKEFIIKSYESN